MSENFEVRFEELGTEFRPVFSEVNNISDGGYERGYAAGYEDGVASIPDYLAERVNGTLAEYASDAVTDIGAYSMSNILSLVKVDFPNAKSTGIATFSGCRGLNSVNLPQCETVGSFAFSNCSVLGTLDLPSAKTIAASAFSGASLLAALILRGSEVCTLSNTNAFQNTPIANGSGYIYVPGDLVDSYKAATNWSTYADQIRAIEDYPEITGGDS